jgi:chemotaxis protein MotB
LGNQVVVELDERGLAIRLKDSILFDSGKAEIKNELKDQIGKIGKIINKVDSYIRVEGHTDNIPISNQYFKSNWQLSAVRAANVAEVLISESGISPAKISAVGYGEYKPIADNKTPEGRAKNRRVEILIVNEKFNEVEGGK